jgi:hypothetical protein
MNTLFYGEMVVTSDGRELTPGVDYEFDHRAGVLTLLPHVRKCSVDYAGAPPKRPPRKAQWKARRWGPASR